jgi:O-antigen/teichoic acid export membrane protein
MTTLQARGSILSTGLATLLAGVGGTALNFVANVALARGLGPSEKGTYDLMIATGQLLTLVVGLSLPAGITYVVARRLADPARLVRYSAVTGLGQGVVVAIVIVLLPPPVRNALVPPAVGVLAALPIGLYVAMTSVGSYWRSVMIGSERIFAMNVRDIAGRAVGAALIVAVIVVAAEKGHPQAITMLWVACAAAFIGSLAFFTRPHTHPAETKLTLVLPTLLGFALPVFASNIVQYLNYRVDLFLVASFRNFHDVGLYAVAVSVAQITWLVSTAAATVLLPRVASQQHDVARMGQIAARVGRITLVACVLTALGLAVAGHPLLREVYGPSYEPAIQALLLLLPGVAALGFAAALSAFIAGIGRPGVNLLIAGGALVVTLAADLSLIPRLGIDGAAIASSISYLVTALLTWVAFIRLAKVGYADPVVPRRADVVMLIALGGRVTKRAKELL